MLIGTHDSCASRVEFDTSFWGVWSKWEILRRATILPCIRKRTEDMTTTQHSRIRDQLSAGAECLDIRVSAAGDDFYASHTFSCGKLETVFQEIHEHLLGNPKSHLTLLIQPDWENRGTMVGRDEDLLGRIVSRFSRLLRRRLKIYYKQSEAGILERYPQILDFNSLDIVWLRAQTVPDFMERFDEECRHRDLCNTIIMFVLSPESVCSDSPRILASHLNPLAAEMLASLPNLPKIVLFDFMDRRLFNDIRDIA